MQYLPEEWLFHCSDLFSEFSITKTLEDLTCQVLLQINRNAKLQGNFQIILGGCEPVKLDIPAQNVLIMGGVAAYRLIMERWPRDIRLNVNSMTSDWFDLEDSIAEKTIKVTLASGGDDTRNTLRKQLKKESTKTPNGAAFRWAVTVTDSGRLALQLQSLPLPVTTIASKPLLLQDGVAVNAVQSWPISAKFFDGENGLSSPVPVLFSDQPEELRSKINDNEDGFFAQLNKFMTK